MQLAVSSVTLHRVALLPSINKKNCEVVVAKPYIQQVALVETEIVLKRGLLPSTMALHMYVSVKVIWFSNYLKSLK